MTKQLAAQLEQLKMTVKSKTAVPTSQVFVSTQRRPLLPGVCGPGSQRVALTGWSLLRKTRLASDHKDPLTSVPKCWEGGTRKGGPEGGVPHPVTWTL